jgi:nitrogen regulatory protein PII
MKMVVAYIKPRMFAAVTLALQDIEGLSGASVGDVRGFGRGRAKNAPDRRQRDLVDYMPRIRIEVACADALATEVVETVERAAHTGLRGDGKIYVMDIEEAVRISTGERGSMGI